jgi:asparagine synthase (glutamine-hydrolysing)
MLDTLTHRGRDGCGLWRQGSLALGHQMLWTTPESLDERLPYVDEESGLVITADARVDNRDELAALLGISRRAAELPDSHLILHAYERWGANCLERVIGDFAFAIWDPRAQRLFCARDRLGAKHFYYYDRPGSVLAFASEIKALLALPFVPRELDEFAVAYHLLPIYHDKAATFYRDVLRLPASECMTVSRERLVFSPSWEPDLGRELKLRSDGEYAEAFRERFAEAVRCRLRSHRPVGSMLSGGLDSSAITGVAGRILTGSGRGPLKTFSAVWPDIARTHRPIDERRFMDAVIAHGDYEPHDVRLDRVSPLSEWETIYWHQDHTLSAPNMYMDWAIFKAAHDSGVGVLLGGTDGDTVVSYGYQDFEILARRGRWLKLLREAWSLSRTMPGPAHSLGRLVWEHGFREAIPESIWRVWRRVRGRPADPLLESPLPAYAKRRPLSPEFVARIGLEERVASLSRDAFPPGISPREMHWRDISSGSWSYILESFEKAAAAHEVEVRYPFFDRRLIEFCLALPPGQRVNAGYTRSILRRAMHGIVPPEVQWRVDKGSLAAGVCLNLLEYERATLEDAVSSESEAIGRYLDLAALRASHARYIANPIAREREAFALMLAVTLGLWLRAAGFGAASGGSPTRPPGPVCQAACGHAPASGGHVRSADPVFGSHPAGTIEGVPAGTLTAL